MRDSGIAVHHNLATQAPRPIQRNVVGAARVTVLGAQIWPLARRALVAQADSTETDAEKGAHGMTAFTAARKPPTRRATNSSEPIANGMALFMPTA
jgi:hypothetical protein